ncbi:MAG: stage 0 sporulation family protein [Eubacteriales bacterium]
MDTNTEIGGSVAAVDERSEYEIIGVRFKEQGKTYFFEPMGIKAKVGDSVIVETARGIEYGFVSTANKIVPAKDVVLPLRPVIRIADEADNEKYKLNKIKEKNAEEICIQKIRDYGLGMKLVDVEYTFDNTKLMFYFTADGRVDFRELVKDLASVFRTRIELRQIGIRDETKLIGGLGVCGLPFCCKKFLPDFMQVSIKMAKEQNLSLNSQKISGACGRLMCCLRYEHDFYEEELKKLPKNDSIVSTKDGRGSVCEVSPITGIVKVKFSDNETVTFRSYPAEEVTVIAPPKKTPKQTNDDDGESFEE